MVASLTEQEFSKHLNTKFRVELADGLKIDLELEEVKAYLTKAGEQTGMERFSAYFKGPGEPFLAQNTYSLQHDRMGTFEIFLVPIARDGESVRYEAVYNYLKSDEVIDS